jgi:hypothetical protein
MIKKKTGRFAKKKNRQVGADYYLLGINEQTESVSMCAALWGPETLVAELLITEAGGFR